MPTGQKIETDDKEFQDIFQSITEDKPQPETDPTKDEEKSEEPQEEPKEQEPQADPEEGKGEEKQDSPPQPTEPEPKAESGESTGEQIDYQAEIKKLRDELALERQRKKSLEGMFNSMVRKTKTTDESAQPEPEEESQEQPQPKRDLFKEVESKILADPKIKAYVDDYPDIWEMVSHSNKIILNEMERFSSSIIGTVAPVLSYYDETGYEKSMHQIRSAYSEFEKWRDEGELLEWIDGIKSPTMKKAYLDIYQQGTADEVIDMLDVFTKQKGYAKQPAREPSIPVDEKKLEQNEGVRTNRTPVAPRNKKADKYDYEGSFNEALRGA